MINYINIHVFGSNLAGYHFQSGARNCRINYGAVEGVAEGLMGESYALPIRSKDFRMRSLLYINASVNKFIQFANLHPELNFIIDKSNFNIQGHRDQFIKPMFRNVPDNCKVSVEWRYSSK